MFFGVDGVKWEVGEIVVWGRSGVGVYGFFFRFLVLGFYSLVCSGGV